MQNMKGVLQLIVFYVICAVKCEIIFSEFSSDIDQCKDVCADSFFLLPKGKEVQDICQRGCRFFNIIYLKDDHDLNITKDECYSSCDEAYDAEPKTTCNVGCEAMSKKKESELSNILIFIEQDMPKFTLVEPDLELLESELISDPLIQSQIEIGYNIEYKIPETKIRTMPIENFVEITERHAASGDWLDCASRNSGIPKWILLSAIVSAVLVALWLSISSEKKVINDEPVDGHGLIKNEVLPEEYQAEELPEKDAKMFQTEGEIEFSKPPRYSAETEKV